MRISSLKVYTFTFASRMELRRRTTVNTTDFGSVNQGSIPCAATMINKGLFSSRTDEWSTPRRLFEELNAEFHFDLDVCATNENAKCQKFFTKAENGLMQDWTGFRVFCNPPYGRALPKWVEKCFKESRGGASLVVMLIPARTDTSYFHEYIYGKAKEIRFLRGRLHFNESKQSAPFPSMIVVF